MKRLVAIVLMTGIVATAGAQEVDQRLPQDSLSMPGTPQHMPNIDAQKPMGQEKNYDGLYYEPKVAAPIAEQPEISPEAVDVSLPHRSPYLLNWGSGAMTGYHSSYNGMTYYGNNAGVMMGQQWGKLTLTSGLNLSKNMYNAVGVVNGIGGNAQLSYPLGRNVSVTAIGGVSHYGFMGPAPSLTTAYYGGYFTLNTNNKKWGVDLGMRSVYNSLTGQWENIPIVMPYYNLGGSKLGIDVGGLLKDFVFGAREATVKNRDANGKEMPPGPMIIAPPINTKPQMKHIDVPQSMQNTCLQ